MKRSRINPISKKRRARSGIAGKLGIIRLYGRDMEALRMAAFLRSKGFCEMLRPTDHPAFSAVRCYEPITWETFELAHIKARRNGGDTMDNVLVACKTCHRNSHNAGGKPCPPKPVNSSTEERT